MVISLRSLDPQRHIAAAVGWSIALLALISASAVSLAVKSKTRADLELDTATLFVSEAAHLAKVVDTRLQDSTRNIIAAASFIGNMRRGLPEGESDSLMPTAVRAIPGFDWTGVVAPDGTILAASDDVNKGKHVAESAILKAASKGPLVSYGKIQSSDPASIIVAAPVQAQGGGLCCIVVGSLGPKWFDAAESNTTSVLEPSQGVEIAIVTDDGTQLAGDWPWPRQDAAALVQRLSLMKDEAGAPQSSGLTPLPHGLTAFARTSGTSSGPADDWWVLMKQRRSAAYAGATAESWKIFWLVLSSGIVTALGASILTSFHLRRLKLMADSAARIRAGTDTSLYIPSGRDEIAAVGQSLATTVNELHQAMTHLAGLNQELDIRVEQRTREVQRLYEDSKKAAITRERLRIARDLHDTLAHSMLAILAQIRMIRKVAVAKPEMLPAELAEAERVAKEGLDVARGSVGQLRYVAVRDDGFGHALAKLVKNLQERIVVEVTLTVAPELQHLSSQTAETLHQIAEEALRNVERHAHAQNVAVSAKVLQRSGHEPRLIVLTIADDGIGFDPAVVRPGHYGLLGLREQASLIDGRIEIRSKAGKGTVLVLKAPLAEVVSDIA